MTKNSVVLTAAYFVKGSTRVKLNNIVSANIKETLLHSQNFDKES